MQAEQDHDNAVTVHLADSCANPGLAVSVLANGLGIARAEAAELLRSPQGLVSAPLSLDRARRLQALLSVLGVRLELRPFELARSSVDLSLQAQAWAEPARIARLLEPVIGGTERDHLHGLCHPSGLILNDLPAAQAAEVGARLRRIKGLMVQRIDSRLATFDIYATRPLDRAEQARLMQLRSTLGLSADAVTGALFANLGRDLSNRVLAALSDLDLLPVYRQFQRFDLHLTGYSGWIAKDLADFLTARTGQPRARFEVVSPADPVRIDLAVPQALARRFCADYAAIGLYVRPFLRGLVENPDNPLL